MALPSRVAGFHPRAPALRSDIPRTRPECSSRDRRGRDRRFRRSHGKSDPVDAIAAARAAQSGEASGEAKTWLSYWF
jgi:hypothetical protein